MLERIIDRISACRAIDKIVIATSNSAEDDSLEEWCRNYEVLYYRGSENDVLGRLSGAVKMFSVNLVVEILGDNPLVHNTLIDTCVDLFNTTKCDYDGPLINLL